MKLLVVEDHPELRDLLRAHLSRAGFAVDTAVNGHAALACLAQLPYDGMVLDLGLGDLDGMEVLRRRQTTAAASLPCLVLSARDALQARIDALDAGADDYLLKPFDIGELLARLRALLRRPGARRSPRLDIANLVFELDCRHVLVDGRALTLARREAMLLEELLRSTPRIVVKERVEERLYESGESVTLNAIEAQVSRLRRKLAAAGARCRIDTVRGLGYRLLPE